LNLFRSGEIIVGFLKFLKREKKEEGTEDLDLPPAPPPLGDADQNIQMPEFPDLQEEPNKGPKLDDLELPDKPEIPNLQDTLEKPEMPDFPPLPDIEHDVLDIPPVSASEQEQQALDQEPEPPTPPLSNASEIREEVSKPQVQFAPQTPKFEHKIFQKREAHPSTVFVKIERFKLVLGDVSIIRSDLRKSEEALVKLETLRNAESTSSEKMKLMLEDLQRKIIFIDKTLFKGG
jgi:hypothetical protein